MIEAMRVRITIQKSKSTTDKNGNHVLVWEDYYCCAAYANNLLGKEYWAAAQINAQTDLYFVIRYCSEVAVIDSEHFRIVLGGKFYNILFVDNVQYKNKTLKIHANLIKR